MKWSHALTIVFVFGMLAAPRAAFALGCSSPSGLEGEMVYNSTAMVVQFCSGDGNWYSMSGTMAVESDPQVGTLTGNKWCAANAGGTAIDCTADAPATGAAGSANEVQFRNSTTGAFAANANFVFDTSTGRLGIGTAAPTGKLTVSGSSGDVSINTTGDVLSFTNSGWNYITALGAAGRLVFQTGGANHRMTIDAIGNVGIGTTAPNNKLEVAGLMRSSGTTSPGMVVQPTSGSTYTFGANTAIGGAGIYDSTAGVWRLNVQDVTGNVGIGTVTPAARLDIVGSHALFGADNAIGATTRTDSTDKGFRLGIVQYANAQPGMAVFFANPTSTNNYLIIGGGTGLYNAATEVIFNTAANTTTTTGTERMRITSAGNVGIGTTSPASLLHVASSGYPQFEKTFAGAPTAADCDAAGELGRQTLDTTNGRFYVCTGTGGWKYTSVGTSGGASSQWIDGSAGAIYYNGGNVGIGTNAPVTALMIKADNSFPIRIDRDSSAMRKAFIDFAQQGVKTFGLGVDQGGSNAQNFSVWDYVSGVSRIIVDGSGNVGIGTANPAVKLDVGSGGEIRSTDGTVQTFLQSSSGNGGYIGTRSNDYLRFRTNNTDQMTITAAGSVGIGTTGPIVKLEIQTGAIANNSYQGLGIRDGTIDFWHLIRKDGSGNRRMSIYDGTGAAPLVFQENGGNVGIGTANPGARLQIVDNSTDFSIFPGKNQGTLAAGYVTLDTGGLGTIVVWDNFLVTNTAYKPGGGSWADSSDKRLKTNITSIVGGDALSKLNQLNPVLFDWRNPALHGNAASGGGFIAQELEQVFPNWVTEITCAGADCALVDGGKIKAIQLPMAFDAYLVKAVQELKADNDNLRAANDNQDDEIRELREEIKALKATIH